MLNYNFVFSHAHKYQRMVILASSHLKTDPSLYAVKKAKTKLEGFIKKAIMSAFDVSTVLHSRQLSFSNLGYSL